MNASRVILLVALGAFAWIAASLWGGSGGARGAELQGSPVQAATRDAGGGDVEVHEPSVRRTKPSPQRVVEGPALLLPGGEQLPALNGVDESVELLWPRTLPWSPVVDTVRDPGGTEWYVHADGSRSTTQMIYRSDKGKRVAMSIVANPATPVKLEGDRAHSGDAKRSGQRD